MKVSIRTDLTPEEWTEVWQGFGLDPDAVWRGDADFGEAKYPGAVDALILIQKVVRNRRGVARQWRTLSGPEKEIVCEAILTEVHLHNTQRVGGFLREIGRFRRKCARILRFRWLYKWRPTWKSAT